MNKLPPLLQNTLLLISAIFLILFGGCVHNNTTASSRESSIPWNRPASWEGAGALGGLGMGAR